MSLTSDLDIKFAAFSPTVTYAHFTIVRFKTQKSNIANEMVFCNDIRCFSSLSKTKHISAQHARLTVKTTPPTLTAHSEELVTNIIMLVNDDKIDYMTK